MFIRKTIRVAAKASRAALNPSLRKRNADAAFASVVADADVIAIPVVANADAAPAAASTDAAHTSVYGETGFALLAYVDPLIFKRAGYRLMCAAYALESMDTSKLA
ncbi:hypothetical protein IWW39_006271 [Coemansia spiralis]|uniref:Uncharacterized protein n=1 Tax=Coemansia spiralis TaxID=417178 RepID=A0A9W8G9A9_9FUNG|nr:hypothetical protein IWW39_006271 [Coemansia spiralis]